MQASAHGLHSERMSRVDTAWLRMDNDVNLMMIVGVWLLTPAVTLQALRERVQERLLPYARFRQVAQADPAGAQWVDDGAFDIAHHVVATALPHQTGSGANLGERAALQRLCGELATTPLDPSRPLWQFHLVEDYEGGCAMVARVHHCIADGIALISVMLSLTDGGAPPPPRGTPSQGGVHLPRLGLHTGLPTGQLMSDLAALALMPDDSPTRLKGRPAGRKRVAWSEPLPLDTIKTIGKGLGCTVNDVLLSCAAGAIGGYLQAQGEDVQGQAIRAMVPVNLRPLDQAWQLGNRFGLVPLVLPVGLDNPVERLYAVRERMHALKGSYQPLLAYGMLSLTGLFSKPVQDLVLGLFARKATAVMTNVPGPAVPLKFCGSTLRQSLFWVPASGDIGVGVSILSYGGGVQFGLITDEALCPEPQAIIDRFEPAFEQLLYLALMLPWAGQDAG